MVSRPDLYDLLWKQVPRENIILGKSFHNYDQDKKSVLVRCTDTSKYYCDILIGADGANSKVRENMYKSLEGTNVLSASDFAPSPHGCICLVGQTNVLDPEEFPDVKEEFSKNYSVVGTSSKYTVSFEDIKADARRITWPYRWSRANFMFCIGSIVVHLHH